VKKGKMPEAVIAMMTRQLLDAFDYIHHELHIVHRDVKPQNILIGLSGGVVFKLCDFGVSGKLENTIGKASTFTGTLTYMSVCISSSSFFFFFFVFSRDRLID